MSPIIVQDGIRFFITQWFVNHRSPFLVENRLIPYYEMSAVNKKYVLLLYSLTSLVLIVDYLVLGTIKSI